MIFVSKKSKKKMLIIFFVPPPKKNKNKTKQCVLAFQKARQSAVVLNRIQNVGFVTFFPSNHLTSLSY